MGWAIVASSFLFLVGGGGSERTLYPLRQGLSWEYQMTFVGPLGETATVATVTNFPERELAGRKVTPQKLDTGRQSSFSFVVSDQTGIYEYASQAPGAVEPEILATPRYYLKYPLKTGASWDETTVTSLINVEFIFPAHTTVESMDDTVTVPAGTFKHCVKTKTVGEGKDCFRSGEEQILTLVSVEEHAWFCPGVGMVKVVRREKKLGNGDLKGVSMELKSFTK